MDQDIMISPGIVNREYGDAAYFLAKARVTQWQYVIRTWTRSEIDTESYLAIPFISTQQILTQQRERRGKKKQTESKKK